MLDIQHDANNLNYMFKSTQCIKFTWIFSTIVQHTIYSKKERKKPGKVQFESINNRMITLLVNKWWTYCIIIQPIYY